jgi:hypothetical protein
MLRTARLGTFKLVAGSLSVLTIILAGSATAQTLRGAVRDSASQRPISGAVVMLLDSTSTVLSRSITDEGGQFLIVRGSAAQTARVVRIGFQPRDVPLSPLVDRSTVLDVSMLPVRSMLAAIRIRDKSNCPRRSDDEAALGLWEQARAALLATVVARETNPPSVRRLAFERRFDGTTDRVTRFSVNIDSSEQRAHNSFNAAYSAEDFATAGFLESGAGDRMMFAPDADVLLDEAFANAYCFHLAPPSRGRGNQVGLAFSPSRKSRDRVDIDGVLWIDTTGRALTDIEFRYLGMPDYMEEFHPGGRISFRQVGAGVVVIDRWYLRGAAPGKGITVSAVDPSARSRFDAVENGGELVSATWPDGRTWHDSLGTLHVHAITLTGQPAVNAVVALPNTHYRATSDQHGDITIPDLAPGPYSVHIVDRRLSELDFPIPTPLKFVASRAATLRATVRIPTAEEYVISRCIAAHQWTPGDSVLIVGRVSTPEGEPMKRADVTFLINGNAGEWRVLNRHSTTDSDGVFQVCRPMFDLGRNAIIRVRAAGGGTVEEQATLSTRLTVVRVGHP